MADKISVKLEAEEPQDFHTPLKELRDRSNNLKRVDEPGFVNEKTGSSITIREDGQVNLSAGRQAQFKINPNNSSISEIAITSTSKVNSKELILNDLKINNHKLNPNLWELTDFKTVALTNNASAIVGNFCVSGTVLVKAWEPNLKRYMLIRRPCRMPVFGNLLDVPAIHPGLHETDPLQFTSNILAKTELGYQVNGIIKDSNSLIGKEGVDRAGITRTSQAITSSGYDSSGVTTNNNGYHGYASNGTGMEVLADHQNVEGEGVERWAPYVADALKANGLEPTDELVSKVLRQIDTESSGDPEAVQEVEDVNSGWNDALGLMQVTPLTFKEYAIAGHDNQMNGYDSLLAGINYAKERYGNNLEGLGEGHGY